MKKNYFFFTFLLFFLYGCSPGNTESQPKISYDYPPPVEGISWGMSEEDLISRLGLEDSEMEWQEYESGNPFGNGEKVTYRILNVDRTEEFLEEEALVSYSFFEGIGLEKVVIRFADLTEQNVEVDVQLKLQESYESSWGTEISTLEEDQKSRIREYFLANEMPEEVADWVLEEKEAPRHPMVSFELDTNPDSPAYGTVVFHGYLAAMVEHALA